MEVDLSGMSEEERKKYESQIALNRENSELFDAMYSFLEESKDVYSIVYGQTGFNGTDPVEGQFMPNEKGGGVVTFLAGNLDIKAGTLTEELFHAFQHDNKTNYAKGEFNVEFEAKVAVTAIGAESGSGYGTIGGMGDFQTKIGLGDYGKGLMQITPENVTSSSFINDYTKAANTYSKYNNDNNIGNSHYRKSTTVAPNSLQRIVKRAYGL